jgi:hypothetical protein
LTEIGHGKLEEIGTSFRVISNWVENSPAKDTLRGQTTLMATH